MERFIYFTDNAKNFISKSVKDEGCLGVRIDIISGGCQGLTYELSFVKEINPYDLILKEGDVDVYVASGAVAIVAGMTVDYVQNAMGGSIVFENPNAKSKCDCGKSFCMESMNMSCTGKCPCQ
jgi:iron-sulfur cluster assembly accessory protein